MENCSDKAGRRFDNFAHAQIAQAGKKLLPAIVVVAFRCRCLRSLIIRLQHIVYIPTADFGQNLRETQAETGDLKSFAQRYFLIS